MFQFHRKYYKTLPVASSTQALYKQHVCSVIYVDYWIDKILNYKQMKVTAGVCLMDDYATQNS